MHIPLSLSCILALVIFSVALSPLHVAQAQTEDNALELITDRPDFTESSAAVPPLHVQAEMGVELAVQDTIQQLAVPLMLFRVGILKNIEVRLGTPAAVVTWMEDQDADTEVAPLELGAKLVLPLGQSAAVGLLPFVALPIKGDHYDTWGVELGARLVGALDLTDRLSLGSNLGASATGIGADDVDVDWEGLGSLSLGITLTDRWGTFLETFVLFNADDAQPFVDTGVTYLVLPLVQLDLYAGIQLDEWPSAFFGCGVSLLW